MDFTEDQIQRYARHIILPEVGGVGQAKLLEARVLVVGAGGLGSPVLLYLGAAGIGHIGVIDDDSVDLSNLQRQVIHGTSDVGRPKAESAADRIAEINPDITVTQHKTRLTTDNVAALIADHDVIVDGTDNFATRYLLNDACYLGGKTLVSAALLRFEAQLSTFKAHLGEPNPCYRCLFREPPPPGLVPSCSQAGILGALCGTVGAMQATEVIKEILGIGQSLSGTLLVYDALGGALRRLKVKRDSGCPLCGDSPTITDLSAHAT